MTKFLKYLLCLGCLIFVNCHVSENEIIGNYIGSYKTNIDSLKILDNGNYERLIYDNYKNKVFSNRGKYEIKNGSVIFNDFLLNEDDLSSSFKYSSKDLTNASLSYEWTISGIKINSNYDLEYFYIKQNKK
jgi:hypothetical protein